MRLFLGFAAESQQRAKISAVPDFCPAELGDNKEVLFLSFGSNFYGSNRKPIHIDNKAKKK